MTNRIPAQCFHPGEYIRDEMDARGWDVVELAKRMSAHDMPVEIVQSLVDCKQDINPNIAFGLRRAFGTSADLWMNLQKAFDVWKESLPSLRSFGLGTEWVCLKCGTTNMLDVPICQACFHSREILRP
jgi:addiction module HigA family antidote